MVAYTVCIYTETGTIGKWQLPIVCCKRKTETANFRLVSANGKRKLVFLGLKTINSNPFSVSANVPTYADYKTANLDSKSIYMKAAQEDVL
jgi:hypothetical protein